MWNVSKLKPRIKIINLHLHWRHNGCDCVSNHQPYDCLLNRSFRRRPKEKSKLRVAGFCEANSPGTGEFPHKWPVTRKKFPFDDVIMHYAQFRDQLSLQSRLPKDKRTRGNTCETKQHNENKVRNTPVDYLGWDHMKLIQKRQIVTTSLLS